MPTCIYSNPCLPKSIVIKAKPPRQVTHIEERAPIRMNSLKTKIEQKLGDHPNVSSNDTTNPDSGTGKGANQGNGERDTHPSASHVANARL